MADLAPADLPADLRARLGDDTAQQKAIDAALVAARRYCGWHVSPVITETVVVDGPGGRVLSLPTRRLVNLVSLTERGTVWDVSGLQVSKLGTVRKGASYCSWTGFYGGIEAEMEHGFTEAEALDWRAAIVRLVDAGSRTSVRDDLSMSSKKVDDVEYQWFQTVVTNDVELGSAFAQYRILPES